MEQKADNKNELTIKAGNNELMEEGNYTILSETGSDIKTWRNNKQNRFMECINSLLEAFQRLLAALDRFTENQVQKSHLSPANCFWWLIVKPNTMHEYYAQLDDKDKEELDSIRFTHYNLIFWLPILLAWSWISSSHDISSFADNFSFLEGNLYRSLLDHWGWLLLAISVSCFGARKKSESTIEELARFPGAIAVAMLVMVLMNAIAGAISGILNGYYFIIFGVIASAVMYSIMHRVSEEDPKISIYESSGVWIGWFAGLILNTKVFDADIVMLSGISPFVILGLGIYVAKATKRGWTWAGWLAATILAVSWVAIFGLLLWNAGNNLLSIISQ